eukprot:TRINITY_DN2672_c0_g1_i1.p1 TRINITY_DN2672_c0_g1~~TRINITY_DN2672_c0_g1_i1.p1  ORF type:complete len:383 (+),score=67.19 TRINITY_DN2672_c0_g1_i1:118-1266(+)
MQIVRILLLCLSTSVFFHGYSYAQRTTTFNIDNYGADYTGNKDSTHAIQTAINDAIAVGGGIVYIPPGNYLITQTLVVNGSVNIQGSTPRSSNLVTRFNGLSWAIGVYQATGVVLRDFGISCTGAGGYGVDFENSFIVTVLNIQVTACNIGVWIDNTGNFDITSLNIWNFKSYCVRAQNINGDLFMTKIHCNSLPWSVNPNSIGLYLSVVSGAKFTDSDFLGGSYGVWADLVTSSRDGPHIPPFLLPEVNITDVASLRPPKRSDVPFLSKSKVRNWDYNSWLQFTSVDCDTVQADPWHFVSTWGTQLTECWSGSFLSGTGIWLGPGAKQVSIVNHQWQTGMIGVGNNAEGISITGGIMGQITRTMIDTSIPNEPTVSNLRQF